MNNKSLLPPNASPLLKDHESAISKRIASLDVNPLRWLNNPEKCPEHILPWLAWSVAVDVWNDNWSVEQKRQTIRQSIKVHKQTGTLGALKRALSTFTYANIQIKEWFETGSEPYTFQAIIELVGEASNFGNVHEIYQTIIRTKNLRSWLDKISAEIKTTNPTPNLMGCFAFEETVTVYPKGQL